MSCNPVNLTLVILNFPANGDTKGAAAAAAASGMSRSVPSSPGDRKQGSIPIVGSAESLVGRVRNKNKAFHAQCTLIFINFPKVLRDQGLGKYCDPEFVRAASREMQEAMDMTPEEFDAAAHQLLVSENTGALRLPANLPSLQGRGAMAPDPSWGDEEDERSPLNPGMPERFTARERQPSDLPAAPSRRSRRGGPPGPPGPPHGGMGRGE